MSFKSANSQDSPLCATDKNLAALDDASRILRETQDMFAEVNEKLDRLMAHLNVPPKPPAGSVRE